MPFPCSILENGTDGEPGSISIADLSYMRRQLRIKVASNSKYSSVEDPCVCPDGKHLSWPWNKRSFRIPVPHNVNYARFEVMGPSSSSTPARNC